MKPKLSVYLSDHVAERLALAARRPGANKSAIVDAALDRFLNPERDPSGDAALVRRLDRINRQLDRVDRDVGIVAETLALYVRYRGRDGRGRRAMRRRQSGRIAKGARRNAGLNSRSRCPAKQIAEFGGGFGTRRWRRAAGLQQGRRSE